MEGICDHILRIINVFQERLRADTVNVFDPGVGGVLQGVVDNTASSEDAKSKALAEITTLAKVMEAEANIETLIEAKGFAECVAVIKDDSASIVVKSDGLQAAQISQINEIVYEQSGISPVNVKIIQR